MNSNQLIDGYQIGAYRTMDESNNYNFIIQNKDKIAKEIKIRVTDCVFQDGIMDSQRVSSKWTQVSTEGAISIYCGNALRVCVYVFVYIITRHDVAYRYKFQLEKFYQKINRITISHGESNPIVTINSKNAIRRDIADVESITVCCCGCCSVEYGLDDIERAEIDASEGCSIF